MSDMHYNGLQWETLALKLIDLFSTLSEATGPLPNAWRPMLPSEEPTLAAADAWRELEAEYRENVHAAARALIKTAHVPDSTPEIIYFLGLRLYAALNHVEAMFVIKDERTVSLWAFPALPLDEVIEWLLINWADDHAIRVAFPAMDDPCAQSTPASSLFAFSF